MKLMYGGAGPWPIWHAVIPFTLPWTILWIQPIEYTHFITRQQKEAENTSVFRPESLSDFFCFDRFKRSLARH